ncbi:hypothetical protein MUK42_25154 [Musa troglodytarum]|uniref:catalase n=1 Tax=Musa troglodytarum TaxID=320322 RepID=A0A9E7KTT9_9LILI|nr:hypothetical protein MUK42_25154 [Musa troglodytarum]URE27245.1 hypothetical protein MUK42_25154 [Musa troglodytarum]
MDPYKYRPSSNHNSPFWTTNSGAPVWNNNSSLTVGIRGPILLEDYHLVEKLAQFDRERIPERVVHARGASAKGFFEVTHDVSHLTCADFLRAPGVQTPVIVRFSTVIHERGSPETLRDPRGFAVKFYTREGNFDLVGNNFPVFFIRDGMKFPDMVHALKPNPKSHIQENWRILDFFSHHPESLHMFSFLFDDVGVPLNYRHMDGSGVHTFTLVNREGKATVEALHPDHGSEHEDRFDFDPLDVTKTWPEDVFPLQPRHRLGPNYLMLPVNAPKCAHHNNHHDGFMNFMHRDEEVNYFPSRYDPVRHAERFPIPSSVVTGRREKSIIKKENNFKQPGEIPLWAPDRFVLLGPCCFYGVYV